ncbi:hypothetical protein [Nonomuraea sp. NPDC049400]|uniref:hypothetical protein n=1 Tax=Nonomuraea sp. NPDC049400 TaxID=3364352 RepID=UPI0037882C9B
MEGLAGEEFYEIIASGAKAKAKEPSVALDVQGPQQFDPTLQTPIVNSVVASRPWGCVAHFSEAYRAYVLPDRVNSWYRCGHAA